MRSYNEGLEAAAKWHDDKARVFRSVTGFGGEIDAHNHGCYARAIRALKREEAPETSDPRDALIKELMGALEPFASVAKKLLPFDEDCDCVSDPVLVDLITCGDLSRAREALSKAKGVVDG